jgi:predicted nucleic acid-binding protein
MIVVSNTSPLNYLMLIEAVEILPRLFGRVYAPPVVLRELQHPGSPDSVRLWAASPPSWLFIQEPTRLEPFRRLDPGEAAAIALAEEIGAVALLIDDRDGRLAARERGLQVVGTLGVLNRAAGDDLIELPQAIDEQLRTVPGVRGSGRAGSKLDSPTGSHSRDRS